MLILASISCTLAVAFSVCFSVALSSSNALVALSTLTLETEKSNKVVADKELEKAQEFDAKLAEDTKNAEENLKAKQEELKAKTTDLDNAKKDEATKKAEYDAVVMPYGRNVKYKIALDQRFVDKFKEYMDYTLNWKQKDITMDEKFAKRKELRKELIQLEKEINHEFLYNRYSHEDDYEIDLKNMSEEERLKMSQYGIYLLNQIRSQFGLEPLKVNKNSMQLAKEITETVMRDNHYKLNGGHYVKGISEVAAKHGLLRGLTIMKTFIMQVQQHLVITKCQEMHYTNTFIIQ